MLCPYYYSLAQTDSVLHFYTSEDKSCDVQRSVCSLCARSFGTSGSLWTWARVSWRRSSSGSGTESDIVKILILSLLKEFRGFFGFASLKRKLLTSMLEARFLRRSPSFITLFTIKALFIQNYF